MAVKPSLGAFQRLIEEQLDSLPGLRFRRMFGGFGIYAGEVFFGLISSWERLYFHTSEQTRLAYEKAGTTFFRKRQPSRPYALA